MNCKSSKSNIKIVWLSLMSDILFSRRTEEIILEHLGKKTHELFDLKNPMFFDKNVLQEKYTNLRRHLDTRSFSEPDDGKILSTQFILNINLILKYFLAYMCNSVHFEVPLKNSRLQSIVNIWVHKSLKFRRRKHHQVEMTEDCDEEKEQKCH